MYSLKDLLESIPTNSCPDREEAKRDLSSAISMDSRKVIENFINCWIDAREGNPHNSIQADAYIHLCKGKEDHGLKYEYFMVELE